MRGSREISLVPSLHRASTDALMKGDVGMSGHGNKKMPTPRYKLIHTPSLHLCSALKFRLFVVNALGKENIFTSN